MPGSAWNRDNVTLTEAAIQEIQARELDGYDGIEHIRTITEAYFNTELDDGEYVRLHFDGYAFTTDTIGGDYTWRDGWAPAPD